MRNLRVRNFTGGRNFAAVWNVAMISAIRKSQLSIVAPMKFTCMSIGRHIRNSAPPNRSSVRISSPCALQRIDPSSGHYALTTCEFSMELRNRYCNSIVHDERCKPDLTLLPYIRGNRSAKGVFE
jgi:hypothetical protein